MVSRIFLISVDSITLCFFVISGCCLSLLKAQEADEQLTKTRTYLRLEGTLLDYLRTAIANNAEKLKRIKMMRHRFVVDKVLKVDPYRYASDPIQHFKLMKRFAYEWQEGFEAIWHDPLNELDEEFQRRLADKKFPSSVDLRNAVYDYLGFQRKRNISAKNLADSDYFGAEYNTTLSSSDCHAIASFCIFDPEKTLVALDWLKEAYARLDVKRDRKEYRRKLTFDLALVLAETGHTKKAAALTERLARFVEFNDYDSVDMHSYFKARHENRTIGDKSLLGAFLGGTTLETPLFPPFRELFLPKICNKKQSLPPSYLAKLKCRYSTNGSPLFVLSPLKEEDLYLQPRISIYRQFMTDSEIDKIINASYGKMYDSVASTEKYVYRTSKTFFIKNETPGYEKLLERTAAMTGLSKEAVEELQVVYYGAAGYCTAHHDAYPIDFLLPVGDRINTVLYYLNDDVVGGETVFYDTKVLVQPEKGSALVWDNLTKNGLINILSGHGSCPVLRGHKWIATRWFRDRGQMLHRPCSLHQEDKT